jgi:hypothetical protein
MLQFLYLFETISLLWFCCFVNLAYFVCTNLFAGWTCNTGNDPAAKGLTVTYPPSRLQTSASFFYIKLPYFQITNTYIFKKGELTQKYKILYYDWKSVKYGFHNVITVRTTNLTIFLHWFYRESTSNFIFQPKFSSWTDLIKMPVMKSLVMSQLRCCGVFSNLWYLS